jgi:hypothetical protein
MLFNDIELMFLAVEQAMGQRQEESASAVAQAGFAQSRAIAGSGSTGMQARTFAQGNDAAAIGLGRGEGPADDARVGDFINVPSQSGGGQFGSCVEGDGRAGNR